MKVLIAAASRNGATTEIAQAIGTTLTELGIDADVREYNEIDRWEGVDAAVLGSAVYYGHWMDPAREFVRAHAAELSARPVWLFSSGPLGDPPKPVEEAVDVEELMALTGAREHRLFAGRLDLHLLHFPERAVVRAVRAAQGDFRDWDAIARWATEIAETLAPASAPPHGTR